MPYPASPYLSIRWECGYTGRDDDRHDPLLQDSFYLFWLCTAGLVAFSLMQLIAFVVAVLGVRRIGHMALTHLTIPAMLGFEFRQAFS